MGTITGVPLGGKLELAIAINGRIAAVTGSFRIDSKTRFETVVPDSAFRAGANRITIFAVRGSPAKGVELAQIASK
jgi:hypothetical protein